MHEFSRKIQTTLYSPEVKRLFVRFFNSTQLNLYFISVIARTKLPHEVVEKVEEALKARIERINAEVNDALDAAEVLCRDNAITSVATYDTEPLTFDAKVISPFARRYLELMMKVDQLMPLLETLTIDELIDLKQLDQRKAHFKKIIRRVAGAARSFASGLRLRMTVMDAEAASAGYNTEKGVKEVPLGHDATQPLLGNALKEKKVNVNSPKNTRAFVPDAVAGAPATSDF